jgi:SulP family sulfate permease
VDGRSVFIALATAAAIIVVKRLSHKLPAAAVVIGGATLLSAWLGLDTQGLRVVRDIAPIEGGLPSLSYPDLTLVVKLIPVAVAVTLLSLVESTSVARSIAGRTGQRLNLSTEFTGEGVANLLAAFFGGYPTTGSLSRSALNEREGATSRLAGFFSGLFVLIAVFGFGSTLNYTPTASLAGLLLVVAVGLVDRPHIARIFRSTKSDRIAFLTTLAGTFFLHLDQAIYVGVGISLVLFLRQARMLAIRDLVIDSGGRLREAAPSGRPSSDPDALPDSGSTYCDQVQCINVEGSVFFGAAGELQTALDDVAQNLNIQVLVIRLKRARNMDVTTVDVLLDFARQWRSGGRHVLLVGMLPGFDAYLRKTGAVDELGSDNVFPQQTDHWFSALEDALTRAYELVGEDHTCDPCNLEEWLHHRGVT